MGIVFLQPWTWLLAAAVSLPIVIHLLARDRSRQVVFPTTRFLEAAKLSAVTRRALQDWPLMAVRIAVVLLAVAALAGPVIVTPGREAAWVARVARAVILHDRTAAPEDELRTAAVGQTFARDRLHDAVHDAMRWLAEQSQAAREIVVLSAFRRGAVGAADFVDVPPSVGVRLIRTTIAEPVREREVTRLQLRESGVMRVTERLALNALDTEAREIEAERLDRTPISVTADPAEQARADAALRAVLRRGLRLPPAGLLQPLTVAWPGDVDRLAALIEARLATPLDEWEPELMTDAELAALARPVHAPGGPTPEDMGDRRTLWALVLLLLGLETWMRRGPAWS